MRKGFTLIELLAVIVILAIIALIATPIVLNIIDETKESATLRSAELYLNSVEHEIVSAQLDGKKIDPNIYNILENGNVCLEDYTLENGKYVCKDNDENPDNNELIIKVDGEKPKSGSIYVSDGKIIDVSVVLNDKTIIKNSNGALIYNPCTLIKDNGDIGVTPGDEYICEVKPGTKYTFYVLSELENGTTNLIMDSNICIDGEPVRDNTCLVAWNESGNLAAGPVTAMNYLDTATKDWSNVENLNITHDDKGEGFKNFKITEKVRLPYHHELNALYDSDTGTFSSFLYEYLKEDTKVTQQHTIPSLLGYWLIDTAKTSKKPHIFASGTGIAVGTATVGTAVGVRPVININL